MVGSQLTAHVWVLYTCLQPAADAADASCALLVMLGNWCKEQASKTKTVSYFGAAHNLSQYKRRENNGAASSVTRATSSVVRAAPRQSRYGLRGVKGGDCRVVLLLYFGPESRTRTSRREHCVRLLRSVFLVTDLPIAVGGFAT